MARHGKTVLGWHDVVKFTLPQGSGGGRWSLLLDTNISDEKGEPAFDVGHAYEVTGRSLLLFELVESPAG